MKTTTIEKIRNAVEKAKTFPSCYIQYNFDELPDEAGITEDNFLGIPARYNPEMSKETGCSIIYKYS